MPIDLSIQLAPGNKRGLLLANPVMTASGTFGYGDEYSQIFDIQRLGAIICKGTTLDPREGNRIGNDGQVGQMTLEDIEKKAILGTLQKTAWNKTKAAKLLNIPRHVLTYRLKKYGISNQGDSDRKFPDSREITG